MHPGMLPAAVQSAFYLAGVVPMFMHHMNGEAYLSVTVTSDGLPLLVIDDEVSPERLAVIADRVLEKRAGRRLEDL